MGMALSTSITENLVKAWLTGRARIRDYHLTHHGGIHAALRKPESEESGEQMWEYCVANTSDDVLKAVAQEIQANPTRLLLVASDAAKTPEAAGTVARRLEATTGLKAVNSDEKLMVTDMSHQDVETPLVSEQFEVNVERNSGWYLVAFTTTDAHPEGAGKLAARGRVAVVDHYAVFDRIWTSPDFRRQGLGSLTMRYLSSLALEEDVEEGLLIAGVDGQALYGYLGWTAIGDVTLLAHPEFDISDDPRKDTFQL